VAIASTTITTIISTRAIITKIRITATTSPLLLLSRKFRRRSPQTSTSIWLNCSRLLRKKLLRILKNDLNYLSLSREFGKGRIYTLYYH
jgi:hypothetical protein